MTHFDPTHEGKLFQDFLKTPGSHNDDIRMMAVSCYGQILRMGLPKNHDCVEFLTHVIDEANDATPEATKEFNHFSELNQHGPKLTEEQQKENMREYEALRDELRSSQDERLIAAMASAFMKQSKLSSQGLNAQARKTLTDFVNRKHLKTIATLSADAASFAMMDPEAGIIPEIDQTGRTEGDRYEVLIRSMRYSLAVAVTDQIQSFFRPRTGFTAEQSRRLMDFLSSDPEI